MNQSQQGIRYENKYAIDSFKYGFLLYTSYSKINKALT